MTELFGDASRNGDWAAVRLRVQGERIVEADAEGLSERLAGLTMLEAAAVDGEELAVEALVKSPKGNAADRARYIIKLVNQSLGIKDDPLLDVALELERIALHDDYFIEKKLYPNIDFYSGITLKAMGFPTTMFTVLFAIARTVGWIAQWKEMIEDPSQKIGRPRQLYSGATRRDYTPISRRK